jgi:hypothetical protein
MTVRAGSFGGRADAISLNTLTYRDDDGLSLASDESNDSGDGPETTRAAYDRLQLLLHSRIEYAISSGRVACLPATLDTGYVGQTWNHLAREDDGTLSWTPFLSGRLGCVVSAIAVVFALLAHAVVSYFTRTPWWLSTYLPPAVAVLLYIVCKAFVDGETRRRSFSPEPCTPDATKFAAHLTRFKMVIVILICPLMAIPILPGVYFINNLPWTPDACTSSPCIILNLAAEPFADSCSIFQTRKFALLL